MCRAFTTNCFWPRVIDGGSETVVVGLAHHSWGFSNAAPAKGCCLFTLARGGFFRVCRVGIPHHNRASGRQRGGSQATGIAGPVPQRLSQCVQQGPYSSRAAHTRGTCRAGVCAQLPMAVLTTGTMAPLDVATGPCMCSATPLQHCLQISDLLSCHLQGYSERRRCEHKGLVFVKDRSAQRCIGHTQTRSTAARRRSTPSHSLTLMAPVPHL